MKFKLLSFLLLSASLFIVSCGDDGPDTCDVLSETVVGSWSVDELIDGTITMNADGTLVDSDNVIFADSLDNTTKTYDLEMNTLTLNADDGTVTTFIELTVSSFTCDQLITSDGANTFTFNRN